MKKAKKLLTYLVIIGIAMVCALSAIIRSFPNTFAVFSQVNQVMGNFLKLDEDGQLEVELLDPGDGQTV